MPPGAAPAAASGTAKRNARVVDVVERARNSEP